MAVRLTYDAERGLVCLELEGPLDVGEVDDALRRITTSAEHAPDQDALWDFSGTDFAAVDSDMVRTLVDLRQRHPDRAGAHIALVVPTDVGFGMGRMHQMLSEELPQTVQVFRDRKAALEWLDDGRTDREDA